MAIKVSLTAFKKAHIKRTFCWVKKPQLRKDFLIRGRITPKGHCAYFKNMLADHAQHVYAILAGRRHVGNCGLKNIIPSKKKGELWIYIGEPSARNKGIGLQATRLLIKKAFGLYGLGKLCVHVASFNKIAQSLYRKIGFVSARACRESNIWRDRGCKIVYMELDRKRWM